MAKLTSIIKGQLHQYFILRIGAFDYRNGWMKCKCPYCMADLKFGINLSLNRTNCFKCGEHPDPIKLVMYLEKVDDFGSVKRILNGGQFEGFTFKEEKVKLRERKEVYLPDGFKSILFGKSQLARSARCYVKHRGFDINKAAEMGWGYGTKDKYFGYLILPFIERGKLTYFNARLFLGVGPKYNNPENSDTGIGKSMIIYNKDALDMYDTVYLCEGLINAATMGARGISSSGKAVSSYQINLIIKSQVKRVVILLDPDAKDKALEVAFKLESQKKVKVVYLPEGMDCNDLGKKKVMEYVRQTPYHDYQALLKLKNNLKK